MLKINSFRTRRTARLGILLCMVMWALMLAACGSQQADEADAPTVTPTWEPVATFTATPLPISTSPPAETATPVASTSESDTPEIVLLPTTTPVIDVTNPLTATEVLSSEVATDDAGLTATVDSGVVVELIPTATPESQPVAPTDSANSTNSAQLTVVIEAANVRAGPGTEYAQIGAVTRDATYPITGRNEAGDWWQFCCVNEQAGWLFGDLVTVQNVEAVAPIAAPPTPIPPTAVPLAEQAPAPVEAAPAEPVPPAEEAPPAPVATGPGEHSGTAGNFDPNAQYHIVHYRVRGFADNNGGIFNNGGQHMIFVTVLDQSGNPVDGAVVKDAVDDKLNIVSGSKGPGLAEFEMFWDRYKLYVASDPSGPVTSQVSNQMNTAYPHIPDIIGLMGPADNEYAICPTADDRCTPPFYHAHWSYEITFQKVR